MANSDAFVAVVATLVFVRAANDIFAVAIVVLFMILLYLLSMLLL